MSDPQLEDALRWLADRGSPRGADHIYELARSGEDDLRSVVAAIPIDERGPAAGWLFAAAAVLVVLLGAAAALGMQERRPGVGSREEAARNAIPTSVTVGAPTTGTTPGGGCRLSSDCAMPIDPRSVAVTALPAGFVPSNRPLDPLAGGHASVGQAYVVPEPDVIIPGGGRSSRFIEVRLDVYPSNDVVARAAIGLAPWGETTFGSRRVRYRNESVAGGQQGLESWKVSAVLNDRVWLFVNGQGISHDELMEAASSVVVN